MKEINLPKGIRYVYHLSNVGKTLVAPICLRTEHLLLLHPVLTVPSDRHTFGHGRRPTGAPGDGMQGVRKGTNKVNEQPAAGSANTHRTQGASVDVLVLDAQYRQALATMRSLSGAGLQVGAAASHSSAAEALAWESRWCRLKTVLPDPEREAHFIEALLAVIDAHAPRMIVPSHDGTIQALRAGREELQRRTFLPLGSEAALDIAISKTRTLALAQDLGLLVPRSVLVTNLGDVPAALREVGCPAVVKPVTSWGKRGEFGERWGCDAVLSVDEARDTVERMSLAGLHAIFQQWLPGRRDAVTFFRASGKIWARFAQTSYREFPPLGGASALCESIPLSADLREPAERLIEAIALDGCSMVEFRRDRAGRPVLMEINARMPGSVALAVSAGVDFPRMLYDWAVGRPLQVVKDYRVGRRRRWLAGDLWNLKWAFRGRNEPDIPSRRAAVATFFTDFVRRPSALDPFAMGDIRPGLAEFRQVVLRPVVDRVRRSAFGLERKSVFGVPRHLQERANESKQS